MDSGQETDDGCGKCVAHFTERRLAQRWSMSPRTLQRWRQERFGPAWMIIGGSVRYSLADIRAYEIASRRRGSSS